MIIQKNHPQNCTRLPVKMTHFSLKSGLKLDAAVSSILNVVDHQKIQTDVIVVVSII